MAGRMLWTVLFALCWQWMRAADDIVVGCGGFVKSDVDINYSLIEVGAISGLRGTRPGRL